jgi:hypothetical protein
MSERIRSRSPDCHERRTQLKAPRSLRWRRPTSHLSSHRRTNEQHKGAALICPILPDSLQTRAMTVTPSEKLSPNEASRAAFHQEPGADRPQHIAGRSISSATGSRTCSPDSKIGGVSQPVTSAAHTPSSARSASPRQSSSGSENES